MNERGMVMRITDLMGFLDYTDSSDDRVPLSSDETGLIFHLMTIGREARIFCRTPFISKSVKSTDTLFEPFRLP